MNLYLDSSALLKRYLVEDGAETLNLALNRATARIASRITFVETMRGVAADPYLSRQVRKDWASVDLVEVSQPVCERAVVVARDHSLKSLDAVHLASALFVANDDLTFATWDRRLHAAAAAEGFETLPPTLD